MSFLHPSVLLLLALPVVLVWTAIGRTANVALPFDHHVHADRRRLARVLTAFDLVPLLLLAVAILVLAGPQKLQQPKTERSLTNIQVCMDVSGSMGGEPYRLASEAIVSFTRSREGDAFGLTLFGSYQIRWVPLTKDLAAVRAAMPFANPEHQPPHMGGTRIGAALRFCRDNMVAEAPNGDRLIVLVSDGESSDLGNGDELEIGAELADERITLYHIHVGESDIPSEVVELARLTGGDGLAAHDADGLRRVFAHIDRMKPAHFRPMGMTPLDHFRPFALAALGLLALHMVGLLGLRYTPW